MLGEGEELATPVVACAVTETELHPLSLGDALGLDAAEVAATVTETDTLAVEEVDTEPLPLAEPDSDCAFKEGLHSSINANNSGALIFFAFIEKWKKISRIYWNHFQFLFKA